MRLCVVGNSFTRAWRVQFSVVGRHERIHAPKNAVRQPLGLRRRASPGMTVHRRLIGRTNSTPSLGAMHMPPAVVSPRTTDLSCCCSEIRPTDLSTATQRYDTGTAVFSADLVYRRVAKLLSLIKHVVQSVAHACDAVLDGELCTVGQASFKIDARSQCSNAQVRRADVNKM